jgi:hypothetical protein
LAFVIGSTVYVKLSKLHLMFCLPVIASIVQQFAASKLLHVPYIFLVEPNCCAEQLSVMTRLGLLYFH